MSVTARSCSSCGHALADGVLFCPSCGAATPTEISQDTGLPHGAATTEVSVEEQRRRVQNALGESFQVLHLLGQGGFAEVWAATDLKLKRQVAVKVLRGDLVISAALSERFRREAEAVAKLRHPNIVPIYQVGEGAGLSFYVMPLIEGESLRHRMELGPLPIAEAQRILEEVAGALSVAHRAGIVHRDIKPDNIMLEGEEARAVVMDFGIAKALSEGESGLTGTGMIVGTPHYMSPEQATGEKTVDSRSDIYSLGVVAYQMVAGQLPFEGDSAQEVLVKHITGKAKPLDAVRPDTPVEFADAVMKCLRKAPAERWNTAGELAQAVRPAKERSTARLPALIRRLRPYGWRHWRPSNRQLVWAATGALVLATVLVFGISPGDIAESVRHWATKAGLAKSPSRPISAAGRAFRKWAPDSWALGTARVLPKGDSGLAVVGMGSRLQLFDGQSWRGYRTPEPIGGAAAAGKDVLLFARLAGGHVYHWSAAGVVPEDTVPFFVWKAWADTVGAAAVGFGDWRLAVKNARGWRRVASPRRTFLTDIGGTAANDLVALGHFAPDYENWPDSILEFDGTSWETLDPRPAGTKELWRFLSITVLGDRSLVIGGEVGEWTNVGRVGVEQSGYSLRSGEWITHQPLLLIRTSPGHWRRVQIKADSAATVKSISGIWGSGPDDLVLWDPSCDSCRLAELRHGVWSESGKMDPGRVLGVTAAAGVPYAVWADGMVWARRNGRWVYVAEVPNPVITSAAFASGSGWSSSLRVGDDTLVSFGCGGCSASGFGDSVLDAARGSAVGRERGWVLGRDGITKRIDCTTGPRCVFLRESFGGGLSLVQRKPGGVLLGGALLVGANGLLMRSDERGKWKRMLVPAEMVRESLYSVSEGTDGRLAVLGSRHLAILDSLGNELRLEPLPGRTRPVGVLLAALGAVALVYPNHVSIERADGTQLWSQYGRIATWLALSDGRLVLGLAGDASNPFATGSLMVLAVDSSAVRDETVAFERARSRVTGLRETLPELEVYTPSGTYTWPVGALPFSQKSGGAPAQGHPQ